jgi:hypothetical protein
MTRFRRLFPVVVSVCLAGSALGAVRPRYGGTLTVETTDAGAMRRLNALAYEPLVTFDASAGLQPALATSWESDARGRRWKLRLRRGVKLHDGATLQPAQIAATLRDVHNDWQIGWEGDELTVDPGRDMPDLPWQLTDASNAIAIRRGSDAALGSGPFRIDRVEGGLIRLQAHDDYWDSRPFLDAVEIRTSRSARDRIGDAETGRADVVSIEPTDVRRLEQSRLRIESSRPQELIALAFEPPLTPTGSRAVRRTFSAAIDREAIARVVLQGRAESANAVLPAWVSGYPALLLEGGARPLSRGEVAALPAARRTLALRVAPFDSVAQAIAQRVAVNARDAGFLLNVQTPSGLGPRFDMRLLRLPFRPASPAVALSDVMDGVGARTLGLVGRITRPDVDASLEDVLLTERALMDGDVIVPIAHIPELYAVAAHVNSWNGPVVLPSGAWNFANVWLNTR